jgi:homoaconitase/3-isopropylmalate dehydratase large subunit
MPSAVKPPQTLYDKVFEHHIVNEKDDGTVLLYIGTFLPVDTGTIADSLQTDIWFTK